MSNFALRLIDVDAGLSEAEAFNVSGRHDLQLKASLKKRGAFLFGWRKPSRAAPRD